ncbi:hypothetical protein CJ030_MR1G016835 [Morella rubra]|uniref:Uncharacterized protein n=1 Tax=Morella rubra TaxID=262757 RepID=A0A6A1WU97_9ROSI|nr:hypothetical protein CJ030_MR1G016835 [Morella rubra]
MNIVENFSKLHDNSMLWPGIWLLFGFGLPEWYKIRSIDSCITRKINKDPDDNSKWYAYSHAIVYEAHVDEKLNSRSFDVIRPDYDEFVEFVYRFETDEGLLKPPLVLRAPKDYSLGLLRFEVHILAKWFLEWSNNLEGWSYIKTSIETHSPDVEIIECGVCLHYWNTTRELYSQIGPQYQYAIDVVHYLANCYRRSVSPATEPPCFF